MKLNTESGIVSTNNTDNQSMDFGIGDVSTIIDILRNRLYSNPIRTLTQEYLCNARDSHREAKRDNIPLKVTLPTKLDSVLKIRDYGVGLSPDRVRDVFVNYGSSTKRKDNVQTGGFGIGAKSAWAYTDSFVVVSYYENKMRTYVAHTGKSSNGTLELMSEEPTDEPNGVEVQIPVKESDIEFFINAVYRCTFFWDVKPDLQGITEIEIPKDWNNLQSTIIEKSKNWILLRKTDLAKKLFDAHNAEIFVLIDKIPYSINKFLRECPEVDKLRGSTSASTTINFIEVENGVLEVSATRESISDKDSSKAKVDKICSEVNSILADCVNNKFNKEPDNVKAFFENFCKIKEVYHLNNVPGFKNGDFSRNVEELSFRKDGVVYSFKNGNLYSGEYNNVNKFILDKQKSRLVMKRSEGNAYLGNGLDNVKFIIKDIPENSMSELAFKEKMRRVLLNFNPPEIGIVYMFNANVGNINSVKEFFDAELLSEIEYERVAYRPKKDAGKVTIRKLGLGSGRYTEKVETLDKKDVTLEDLVDSGKTYVLVPFSGDEMYEATETEFVQNIKFITNNAKNTEVVKVSKKEYEVLCLLDNTVEYTDLIQDFPSYVELDEQVVKDFFSDNEDASLEHLRKFVGRINCPKIRSYFETVTAPDNDRNRYYRAERRKAIPDRILKNYEFYNKALVKNNEINALKEEIFSSYPLIKYVSNFVNYGYYGHDKKASEDIIKEVLIYINGKASK